MDDNSIMPFGKYKDTPLKNVPDRYLLWLYENWLSDDCPTRMNYPALKAYIEENLDAIRKNAGTPG